MGGGGGLGKFTPAQGICHVDEIDMYAMVIVLQCQIFQTTFKIFNKFIRKLPMQESLQLFCNSVFPFLGGHFFLPIF